MKGGFLKKPRPEAKPVLNEDGRQDWPEKMADTTVQIFVEILGEKDNVGWNDLERRLRSGTGAREYNDMTSLHGHGHVHQSAYGLTPEDFKKDMVSRLIEENTTPSALRDVIQPVMEQASSILGRVKDKGKADGVVMDNETEVQVSRDIIKEALIRHLLKVINNANSGSYAAGSVDAGLLATPQGYYAGDLESLQGDTIRALMERGYGVQDDFMGGTIVHDVFKELELLEFDGKFVEVQQQKLTGVRTDKLCWYTPDDVDREKQPGLSELFKKLISVPFELNKKCNLCLQGSASFQLAFYPKTGFYKKHVDSGYGSLNNGRKLTAVYYVNPSWCSDHGGQLRMYKRQPNPYELEKMKKDGVEAPKVDDEVAEDIEPRGDRLVLFRSRDMMHEVLPCQKKRFAISLWIHGPPGPGDQPDGYYTPT